MLHAKFYLAFVEFIMRNWIIHSYGYRLSDITIVASLLCVLLCLPYSVDKSNEERSLVSYKSKEEPPLSLSRCLSFDLQMSDITELRMIRW